MTSRYAQLLFTPAVQEHQTRHASRRNYAAMSQGPARADSLTRAETEFIAGMDSFYLASTGSTGWPYVQHRGGPPGFLRVLDEQTLGFADFRGNRQYITTGNLDTDDRVSLFLMDYPARRRLKVLGRARTAGTEEWPSTASPLLPDGYSAVVERIVLISVEAYDWNCPQHIQPRLTPAELGEALGPVRERMAALEEENARLKQALAAGRAPGREH
ncbi:pyridoxamine 5'-phosphate oxidase family protein [Streptomyces sp. NBC_01218]|uniref:pyridoxamine 5'-phosphate oxidase family protein n=1 Tax=unclassified Streptomyces TaxID=2593676 RepID=UPI0023B88E6B|nr:MULTISPECIES: pyridoxamine 5'-phosphate oxidase family protein [unclassified Streptomyces]WEH39235.1 pyridoxamine 5'-phosphate oxidase family protein [Streptomyces sp. AM 2-1-1]WSQ50885.1 pyridoxamine 5'-phosphate oxidase family protein [Streptomyces sp. NBC_01218]